jgi:uncharacterized protein (TIGR02996 family)
MLKIANRYGNCEVGKGVPKGYVHIRRPCHATCRKLGIRYVPAVVGWHGDKKYGWKPQTDGVVVTRHSASRLRSEFARTDLAKVRRDIKQKLGGVAFRLKSLTDWLVYADWLDDNHGETKFGARIRRIVAAATE